MKPHRQELVYAFIERHRLHLPGEHRVNIADLYKDHRPILAPRLPCVSMVMDRVDRRGQPHRQIWMRRELSGQSRRLLYVHERMHDVLGHDASIPLYEVNPWFYDRDEREAWEAAAMVFVPRETFFQAPDVSWLSMVTHAPVWLIHMLPLMKQHFRFPAIGRPAIFR